MTFNITQPGHHTRALGTLDAALFTTDAAYLRHTDTVIWHPAITHDNGHTWTAVCSGDGAVDGDVIVDGPLGVGVERLGLCQHNACQHRHAETVQAADDARLLHHADTVARNPHTRLDDVLSAARSVMRDHQLPRSTRFVDPDVADRVLNDIQTWLGERLTVARHDDPGFAARCHVADITRAKQLIRRLNATFTGTDNLGVLWTAGAVVANVWPTSPGDLAGALAAHCRNDRMATEIHRTVDIETRRHATHPTSNPGVVLLVSNVSAMRTVAGYPHRRVTGGLLCAVPTTVSEHLLLSSTTVAIGPGDVDQFDRTVDLYRDMATARSTHTFNRDLWAAARRLA